MRLLREKMLKKRGLSQLSSHTKFIEGKKVRETLLLIIAYHNNKFISSVEGGNIDEKFLPKVSGVPKGLPCGNLVQA
jgi:hypothetical protein